MNRLRPFAGYSARMARFRRHCCALLAGALLGGCTSWHTPTTALELAPIPYLEPDRFAAGRSLLPGKHPPAAGETWRSGDSVLLGIAIDAAGQQREWYLRATIVGKIGGEYDGTPFTISDSVRVKRSGRGEEWVRIDYDLVRVKIELFDGETRRLSRSTALMPELCLQYGLLDYIEQSLDGRDAFAAAQLQSGEDGEPLASEELRRAVAGWIAIMKLPEFLQRERSMEQLIWRIIERPNLLSLLMRGRVNLDVGLSGEDARPETTAGGFEPAYRVPVSLTINGRPAVRCEIVVTRADPPLGPCGGLLAIDATHPSDPQRKLSVRLLGARRGG
jgi:hypothetical protein